MSSARRAARRQHPAPSSEANGIPDALALGPCVEVWANPAAGCPTWSALRNWSEARDAWAAERGLHLPTDYRHLPGELAARAPYWRTPTKETH